jgi:hypothetical protein
MDARDSIWKNKWKVLIESGDQTVASATVFSGQLRRSPKFAEIQKATKMHDPCIIRKLG